MILFRRKIFGSLIYTFLLFTAKAQTIDTTPSNALAMGSAVVSLNQNELAGINPSVYSEQTTLALNYNRRFMLAELSTRSLLAVIALKQAQLIAQTCQVGNSNYQESLFELGAARKFSPKLSMGITFRYYILAVSELMQNPQYLSFNWGMQYQEPDYGFGLAIANPFGTAFHQQYAPTYYPSNIKLGAHRIFQQCLLSTQISLNDYQKASLQIGSQYDIRNEFILRLGIQTESPTVSMGIGWYKNCIQLDYTFAYHSYLGFSPSFAILFKP